MKYLFFSVNHFKYRFTCQCTLHFWLINLIKIYLIRILRDYLLRANTDFFKIIMIFTFISFMITDKWGKTMTFSGLTAQWILHSDIEGSFDCASDVFTNLLLYWLDGSQNIHLWSHFSLAVFSTQSDMYTNIHRHKNAFTWSKSS